MEQMVIHQSRGKLALWSVLCLILAVAFLLLSRLDPGYWLTYVIAVFFGALGLLGCIRLVRPGSIILDANGFTMSGRFRARHDTSPFYVMKLPQGGTLVAYDNVAGSEAAMLKAKALGGTYPGSKADLVKTLNAYRDQALEESGRHTNQ